MQTLEQEKAKEKAKESKQPLTQALQATRPSPDARQVRRVIPAKNVEGVILPGFEHDGVRGGPGVRIVPPPGERYDGWVAPDGLKRTREGWTYIPLTPCEQFKLWVVTTIFGICLFGGLGSA